jgi:hypothetical protein
MKNIIDYQDFVHKFGVCEMYEIRSDLTGSLPYGTPVQLSKTEPGKIEPYTGGFFLGFTAMNGEYVSDDPEEHPLKWCANGMGDPYMERKDILRGQKVYDPVLEMTIMTTVKDVEYTPIKHPDYDDSAIYMPRSTRQEWRQVNILGKCYVLCDDSSVQPGDFVIVTGKGTVKKASTKSTLTFPVLNRIDDTTILIFNYPQYERTGRTKT